MCTALTGWTINLWEIPLAHQAHLDALPVSLEGSFQRTRKLGTETQIPVKKKQTRTDCPLDTKINDCTVDRVFGIESRRISTKQAGHIPVE